MAPFNTVWLQLQTHTIDHDPANTFTGKQPVIAISLGDPTNNVCLKHQGRMAARALVTKEKSIPGWRIGVYQIDRRDTMESKDTHNDVCIP